MARRLHAGSTPRPHAWAHAQEHGHAQSVTLPPPRNLSDNRCLSVCLFVSKITEKVIKMYNEILTGQGINGYILVTFWKLEGLWSLSNLQYYVTLYYYSTYYFMYISIISIKIRMNKYAWIMCEWIKWQIRWCISIKNIILFLAIWCFINVYILWVWRGNTHFLLHTQLNLACNRKDHRLWKDYLNGISFWSCSEFWSAAAQRSGTWNKHTIQK